MPDRYYLKEVFYCDPGTDKKKPAWVICDSSKPEGEQSMGQYGTREAAERYLNSLNEVDDDG